MSKSLAFLTGLGNGYISSADKTAKQAQDDEDRALRNEASRFQIDELLKGRADKQALADAAKPLTMAEGAGGYIKPPEMDNRDVGLPENAALPNAGLQTGNFSVAGKSFVDRAAADAELAQQNSPQHLTRRFWTTTWRTSAA